MLRHTMPTAYYFIGIVLNDICHNTVKILFTLHKENASIFASSKGNRKVKQQIPISADYLKKLIVIAMLMVTRNTIICALKFIVVVCGAAREILILVDKH